MIFRRYSCDSCNSGRGLHGMQTSAGEGTFCCDCCHCSHPDECETEWVDEQLEYAHELARCTPGPYDSD